jgi:chaperonin GroEL
MRKQRFTLEPDYAPLPSNYLVEGDQLTLRTKLDYLDHFSNQPGGESVILEDVLVLLSSVKISNMRDMMSVLEPVARKQASLLVIAPEVEGEALATLATNRVRGTLMVCPVNFRAHGRDDLLQIKKFTGGLLFGDLLQRLEYAIIGDLGRASKVIVERHQTRLWRAKPPLG